MALTHELETLFLEVLNTSWIYPITSKVCFVKRLANYTKSYSVQTQQLLQEKEELWQN